MHMKLLRKTGCFNSCFSYKTYRCCTAVISFFLRYLCIRMNDLKNSCCAKQCCPEWTWSHSGTIHCIQHCLGSDLCTLLSHYRPDNILAKLTVSIKWASTYVFRNIASCNRRKLSVHHCLIDGKYCRECRNLAVHLGCRDRADSASVNPCKHTTGCTQFSVSCRNTNLCC